MVVRRFNDITETYKNYAIIADYGKRENSNVVNLIPIELDDIQKAASSETFDCVLRLAPDTQEIYSIHIGNDTFKDRKGIDNISRIFGLHKENRVNWVINRNYNFRTDGFDCS